MKWYDYIILRLQEYKWYLVTPFFIAMAVGIVEIYIGHTPNIGGMAFFFMLIAWGIVWGIASYLYRKNLKK